MGKTNSNVDPNTEPTESWREKTVDPKEVKGIDTSSGEDYSIDSEYSDKSTQLGDLREADYYTPGQSAISKISGTKVDIGAASNNLTVSAAAAAQFTPVDIAKGIRDPNERARYIAEQGSKMTNLMDGLVGIKFDDEIADYAKYRQNQYDNKVSKFLDDLDENQGFWKELGNFGGKLLGRTATAVSGIIPAVYGIGSAIINMDGKKLYDNGAYDAWESMDKSLDEYFVVYGGDSYTSGEEKNVFARFMDNPMKSLADDFAPTIAFVAGAVGTSYITGGVGALQASKGISYINGLSKASAKTNLVFKNGVKWARGIKNFEDVAEYSNFVNKYSKGLGTINQMVLSASYESALIARDTKNSTSLNSKINYIKDTPELAKEYDALVRKHMDEFGNMDKTQEELVEEVSKKIPKRLLRQMEYASKQAGNLAFFTNVPLVGASNLIQFSKAFNSSYKAGQSLISKSSINPLKGVVKTAEGKLATAASQANKFKKILGYTGIVLKPGLTEAFEEFSQGVIEKGYSDYYALEFKDGAIRDTKDFLKSIGSQASLYANSVEGFDSVALGFLMGIVGLPLGIKRDSETGKTKVGFGFTGGVKESIEEFREELRKTNSAVEHYNKDNFNEVVKNNLNAAIKQIQIQKDLDKYAEEENIFDYKNAEFQSIYNFIENRIKNEIGETVFQDIDALEEMSLEQFNEEFAFKEDAMQFTEKTKKQAIESMRSTAESIVKAHEDVNNVLNYKRGFIDNIFKTDFDGLSNKDQFLTESLTDQMKFLYASGLNIKKREEELTKRMSDLTKGKLNVSELGVKLRSKVEVKKDGKTQKKEDTSGLLSQEIAGVDAETGKATFADQVAELKKMIKDQIKFDRETEIEYNKNSVEINQIVEDVVKLRDMESKTWEIYKTLFTPKGAKKFAEIKSQLVIYKAIELQKLQAEQQKEELVNKKSSEGASKVAANATSTNNEYIVEEQLQKDLQKVDRVYQEEKQKLLKNKNQTEADTANFAIKVFENISPLLFAKIKEIANNSEEYTTVFSDEIIDVIQGNADPATIENDRITTIKILNQLIKANKEANNKPIVTLDYANEEDNKPFVNSVTPTPGSTKENHDTNTHLSLIERLKQKVKKQQEENYVKEKTTASDKTTILMYSDKIGRTGLIPDGDGGYIAVNNDMPITEASNKKVNDGNFLSNEELKNNNIRATFKLVEDSPFIKELKAKNNYNETTAPIDVYYGDTFIGRLPGSSETSTPEQLRNLRKALFKQLTADEAVSQEAPGVYTGYKSTAAFTGEARAEETTVDIASDLGLLDTLKENDLIIHPEFGRGKIVNIIVDPNGIRFDQVEIFFPHQGKIKITINTLKNSKLIKAPKTETKEKPTFEDSRVSVGRKTFTITDPVEGITDTYRYTEYLDGSIGNFKMISEDGKASDNTEIFNALKSFEDIKAVYEKQKGFKVEITQEEDYKSVMNPKMFDKLTIDQQRRVDPERAKETTTQDIEAQKAKFKNQVSPIKSYVPSTNDIMEKLIKTNIEDPGIVQLLTNSERNYLKANRAEILKRRDQWLESNVKEAVEKAVKNTKDFSIPSDLPKVNPAYITKNSTVELTVPGNYRVAFDGLKPNSKNEYTFIDKSDGSEVVVPLSYVKKINVIGIDIYDSSLTETTTQETENIKKEREALDKQYAKNSQIAIDDKVVDEYSKIETGYKEESLEKLSPRTLKEALKDLESFLEKTFGWTNVNVFYNVKTIKKGSVETTVNEFTIQAVDEKSLGQAEFTLRGGRSEATLEGKVIESFNLPLNKIIDAKYNIEQQNLLYIQASEKILDAAVKEKILTKSGETYSWGQIKLGETKEGVIELLKDNPELAKELNDKLKKSQLTTIIPEVNQQELDETGYTQFLDADGEVVEMTKDIESAPETEVEQTAREKVIEENFENIIKALTANPIMQGDEFIGEKKC